MLCDLIQHWEPSVIEKSKRFDDAVKMMVCAAVYEFMQSMSKLMDDAWKFCEANFGKETDLDEAKA